MNQKLGPFALSLLSVSLLTGVKADLAVHCYSNSNPDLERTGGIVEYEACDGLCQCDAFELACMQRDDAGEFSLVSMSFTDAAACVDERKCICNSDETAWASTAPINFDEPLPDPVYYELPDYSELKANAELEEGDET